MKNKFIKISFSIIALLLMFSCDGNEDYTNDSVQSATSPNLTVSLAFDNEQTLVEMEKNYAFTVTISGKQIVNTVVFLEQTAGTATDGVDYTIPHTVTIPKGSLTASGVITIHSDELIEDTETATIKIGLGNEANVASVSSETVTFNIGNLTSDDLVATMSWGTSVTVTDNFGKEIDAYKVANLKLLLTDIPYQNVIEKVDGAKAETFTLTSTTPDGEYYLVAEFVENMDIVTGLDLTLTFDQVGTIKGEVHTFNKALNPANSCANPYFVMAKVTKTGGAYVIERIAENSLPQIASGTYDVVSNGTSTDSGPVNNPLVNFMSTVTITNNGDFTYKFSDGWAGVYIDWYSIYGNTAEEPQTITYDVCKKTLSASWKDIFGGAQTLTGTINADGTLAIRIDNAYGDFADAIYTLQ